MMKSKTSTVPLTCFEQVLTILFSGLLTEGVRNYPNWLRGCAKYLLIVLFLAIQTPASYALDYYYKGTGSITSTANWSSNSNPAGFGLPPLGFTLLGGVYHIQNTSSVTLDASWTVGGLTLGGLFGLNIIVGDGTNPTNLIIPAGFTLSGSPIDVANASTLTIANTTIPTLGTLNTGSMVIFNATATQAIPSLSYANLTVSGSATNTVAGSLSVSGALNVTTALDLGTNVISTMGTNTGTGTIYTQNTSTTPIPSGKTWASTIAYNSASSGQTVVTGSYATLTMSGTGTKTFAAGTTSVSGSWNSVGGIVDLTTNAVTLDFNGASAQTITNSNTGTSPTVKFGNSLIFSGGGTKTFAAGGYYSVATTGVVTVSGSSKVAIPNATTHLQFLATGTAYAQIGNISSGSSIQGNVDYQVYFTGGSGYRNYRAMAAPVYSQTYSATNGTYSLLNLQSSFIITGSGGTGNGFDASSNNGATLRTYNPATNNYTFITSFTAGTTVLTGTGFYLYYRGTRTAVSSTTAADPFGSKTNKTLGAGGNTYATPEAITYTYTGVPNQQSIIPASLPSVAAPSLYYLISNPYAATFDAGALITANNSGAGYYYISRKTWTWSPAAGAYAVYDQLTPASSTNGAQQYVPPGQAFFVQNNNQSGSARSLTVTEAMKSTLNVAAATVNRFLSTSAPIADVAPPVTRLQLFKNNIIKDEVAIVFNSTAKDSLDQDDAAHLNGDYMNLTTITPDNNYLAIDYRPATGTKTVIPLFVNVAEDSTYMFKSTYNSPLMANYKITLFDSLLNTNTDIVKGDYTFTITRAQAATYGKRFKLIVEPAPAPVTYLNLNAKLSIDRKGIINWKTNGYRYGMAYQLQRSQDNVFFVNVGDKQVALENFPNNSFDVVDTSVPFGKVYYRVAQTDMFNNTIASATISLNNNPNISAIDSKNGFKLYPNPVTDNFSVISDKGYTGKVTMTVYSSTSDILFTKQYTQLNALTPVQEYVSQLRPGVFFVELKDESSKVLSTLKFLKN